MDATATSRDGTDVSDHMRKGGAQDRFLAALLGMSIGDALGMPVAGWSAATIVERFGAIDGYHRRVFADGAEIKAGEFTDESEIAFCIVESATVNDGVIDAENIAARMRMLARGESKRWMGAATLAALNESEDEFGSMVALDEDGPATGDVASRGIPIGLLHGVGRFDLDRLKADAESVTRITHGSPVAISAVTAVALGVQLAVRGEQPKDRWPGTVAEILGHGSVAEALGSVPAFSAGGDVAGGIARCGLTEDGAETVAGAFLAATAAGGFVEGVLAAVNAGGATDSRAAIAGALLGTANGAAAIPQPLIDDLEGRIYASLAAPWFYRSALRRAGLVISMRPEQA